MAIIDNRVTAEGDVLIIKPEIPIVGILALYQFVDTTIGESETDYFKKEFRYSIDGGLTFSIWNDLNLINIQNISISKNDSFVIEYRYTRVGNAPDVELSFNDILVSGEIEGLPYPIYDKTIFKKFFNVNDINVFGWAINVLEKLYTKGLILPDYIVRADNNDNLEDEDFIVYWNTITHVFAIIVYFARQFHNIDTNELLLIEFLKNKDLSISNDYDQQELTYLFTGYIEEYKKRGTYQIIDKNPQINGELIRLINLNDFEEFIFAIFKSHDTGWCLGKSSPTWSGTENILNINKSQIIESILSTDTVINHDKVIVSSTQVYEVSFRIKTTSPILSLDFGINCWDKDNNPVTPKNNYNNSFTNLFVENLQLKMVGEWYWIRGVIYPYSSTFNERYTLNVGVGNNLRFLNNISQIQPFININGVAAGDQIDRFIVRPAKLNFSRGQLGVKNIIYLVCPNNSSKDDELIIDFIKNNLIPYDKMLKTNIL